MSLIVQTPICLVDISEDVNDSTGVNVETHLVVGVYTPANITGTGALTFKGHIGVGDEHGSDSAPAFDHADWVLITGASIGTTAASTYYPLDRTDFLGVRYVQIICATNQATDDKEFKLALRHGSA